MQSSLPSTTLEAAIHPRPRLDARGIEALGGHQLDGVADGSGQPVPVDVVRGGPRHASEATDGWSERQCIRPSAAGRTRGPATWVASLLTGAALESVDHRAVDGLLLWLRSDAVIGKATDRGSGWSRRLDTRSGPSASHA